MANKAPAIKSKEIHYEYVDGIKIVVSGSDTIAVRQKLYDSANVVVPPVITPPVNDSDRKLISFDELLNLKNTSGKYKLKPGIYNQQVWWENVGVDLDLTGVTFQGMNIPAFELNGNCSNLKLSGVSFKDMQKCISYKHNANYVVSNFTIENVNAENIGQLFGSDGGVSTSGFRGVFNNFTFTNSKIINSPNMTECIWMGLSENFNIHDITFDNVNGKVTTHAGIFTLVGNGKLYNIKAANYQGNIARFRPLGIDKGKTLEAYNVLGYNNSMYSLFEVQVFDDILNSGYFNPVAISIHNNTGLQLSTLKTREGQILDVYNIGASTMEYYNNIGAAMFTGASSGVTDMINNNYQIKFLRKDGNVYKLNIEDAVDNNFKSKIAGVGAAL